MATNVNTNAASLPELVPARMLNEYAYQVREARPGPGPSGGVPPLIADSVCLTLINNGELGTEHVIARGDATALTQNGRRKVIEAYERRMDILVTHPLFGYAVSYRRILEMQARLLSRHLLGELSAYPVFRTR